MPIRGDSHGVGELIVKINEQFGDYTNQVIQNFGDNIIESINNYYSNEYGDVFIDTGDGSVTNNFSGGEGLTRAFRCEFATDGFVDPDLDGIEFNKTWYGPYTTPPGTKMFVCSAPNDLIYEFSLDSPYDISSRTQNTTLDTSTDPGEHPDAMAFSDNGEYLYAYESFADAIWYYQLSTPWDLTSATLQNTIYDIVGGSFADMSVSNSGTRLYATLSGGNIQQLNFGTAYDPSTLSVEHTINKSTGNGGGGCAVTPDGRKLVWDSWDFDSQTEIYHFGTAWDLSTASLAVSFDRPVKGQSSAVSPDGTIIASVADEWVDTNSGFVQKWECGVEI